MIVIHSVEGGNDVTMIGLSPEEIQTIASGEPVEVTSKLSRRIVLLEEEDYDNLTKHLRMAVKDGVVS